MEGESEEIHTIEKKTKSSVNSYASQTLLESIIRLKKKQISITELQYQSEFIGW